MYRKINQVVLTYFTCLNLFWHISQLGGTTSNCQLRIYSCIHPTAGERCSAVRGGTSCHVYLEVPQMEFSQVFRNLTNLHGKDETRASISNGDNQLLFRYASNFFYDSPKRQNVRCVPQEGLIHFVLYPLSFVEPSPPLNFRKSVHIIRQVLQASDKFGGGGWGIVSISKPCLLPTRIDSCCGVSKKKAI